MKKKYILLEKTFCTSDDWEERKTMFFHSQYNSLKSLIKAKQELEILNFKILASYNGCLPLLFYGFESSIDMTVNKTRHFLKTKNLKADEYTFFRLLTNDEILEYLNFIKFNFFDFDIIEENSRYNYLLCMNKDFWGETLAFSDAFFTDKPYLFKSKEELIKKAVKLSSEIMTSGIFFPEGLKYEKLEQITKYPSKFEEFLKRAVQFKVENQINREGDFVADKYQISHSYGEGWLKLKKYAKKRRFGIFKVQREIKWSKEQQENSVFEEICEMNNLINHPMFYIEKIFE